MGGMIARYAAGLLYRPADGTIAGLTPRHFVTLASPHLGLTVDAGPAQVPFVAWAGHLPVLGGALQRGLQVGAGVRGLSKAVQLKTARVQRACSNCSSLRC